MVQPYLDKNGLDTYNPEEWVDEVKELGIEGTPQDQFHFNHMEGGIHNGSEVGWVLLEAVKSVQEGVKSVEGELIAVTLTNTRDFYFNNSVKTVALSKKRDTLDYRVFVDVQGNPENLGEVVVYDKQLNGFKIKFTGSAKTVTVKCYVQGGVAA